MWLPTEDHRLAIAVATAADHVERARRLLRLRVVRLERLIERAYGVAGNLPTVREAVSENQFSADASAQEER